jgi:hypothetical protein
MQWKSAAVIAQGGKVILSVGCVTHVNQPINHHAKLIEWPHVCVIDVASMAAKTHCTARMPTSSHAYVNSVQVSSCT